MNAIVLEVLEYAGIFVFALTGALVAARRDFDAVGLIVLAVMTGLGGGILRDVLLGVTPPTNLASWERLLTATIAALLILWQYDRVRRREQALLFLDAIGLATFCVTGTIVALDHDASSAVAALFGVLTATGGGVVRDVLSGRTPVVFSGELYVVCALLGAASTVVVVQAGGSGLALIGPAGLCLALRLAAMRWGWRAPRARRKRS